MGTPADRSTRVARMYAHAAFDKLWQQSKMRRKNAYRWLAKVMETKGECHIGDLSESQCKKVIEMSGRKFASLQQKER